MKTKYLDFASLLKISKQAVKLKFKNKIDVGELINNFDASKLYPVVFDMYEPGGFFKIIITDGKKNFLLDVASKDYSLVKTLNMEAA